MRKIKVFSTATGLKIVESSAVTWGELKEELSNADVSVSNVKAVENKTNTTLELDDAKLPESDFVLMLSPEKTKSGSVVSKLERLAEIFGEAQEICEDLASEIEDNGDDISSSVVSSTSKALSFEDMEAMEDLKRLQGGY